MARDAIAGLAIETAGSRGNEGAATRTCLTQEVRLPAAFDRKGCGRSGQSLPSLKWLG